MSTSHSIIMLMTHSLKKYRMINNFYPREFLIVVFLDCPGTVCKFLVQRWACKQWLSLGSCARNSLAATIITARLKIYLHRKFSYNLDRKCRNLIADLE